MFPGTGTQEAENSPIHFVGVLPESSSADEPSMFMSDLGD